MKNMELIRHLDWDPEYTGKKCQTEPEGCSILKKIISGMWICINNPVRYADTDFRKLYPQYFLKVLRDNR